MIINDFDDLDGSDGHEINTLIRLSRDWVVVRPEHESMWMHQVHSELVLPFPGKLMATYRPVNRDHTQVVGALQHRHTEHYRPRHTVAISAHTFTHIVETTLQLAGPESNFQANTIETIFITIYVMVFMCPVKSGY